MSADRDAAPSLAEVAHGAIARSVAQILRHDAGVRQGDDPEDVHKFRVGTRRLRSDLRTFAALFDAEWVAHVRAELAWIGAEIGAVRDTQVLADRLRTQGAELPAPDRVAVDVLLDRLADQHERQRSSALAALCSARCIALLETLESAADQPPVRDGDHDEPAGETAVRLVRRQWRRLRRAVADLADEPSDRALHRVRILAKRCRYAAEAVVPVTGEHAARFAAAIADVQTILGDHQDAVVAEAWLRAAAGEAPDTALAAGQLVAMQRADRARARSEWPRAWKRASAAKRRAWLDA